MQDHNLPVALERFMPEDAAFPLVAPLQERVRQVEQYHRVKPAKAAQMFKTWMKEGGVMCDSISGRYNITSRLIQLVWVLRRLRGSLQTW